MTISQDEQFQKIYSRLAAIMEKREGVDYKPSQRLLVIETMRRLKLWTERLHPEYEHWMSNPLYWDFARLYPNETLLSEDQAHLVDGLSDIVGFLYKGVFARIINWYMLQHKPEIQALYSEGFLDPYEPLINFYERGGYLWREHGWTMLSHSAVFSPGKYVLNRIEADIRESELVYVDSLSREELNNYFAKFERHEAE